MVWPDPDRDASSKLVRASHQSEIRPLIVRSTSEFDTGSTDILIPTTQCTDNPGCTIHKRFDPSKSSTFQTNNEPFSITFSTGGGVAPLDIETAKGYVGTDTFAIAGLAVQNQGMGLATSQTAGFSPEPFDAITGLGLPGETQTNSTPYFQNLIQTGQVDQPMYGLYFSPRTVGNAELTLGGVDQTKITGSMRPLPMNTTFTNSVASFVVNFDDILVNNKSTKIGAAALLDSGTSNVVAESNDAAAAVYAQISPNIKLVDPNGGFAIPCDELNTTAAVVDFSMGGNIFRIPSNELSVGPYPGMPGMCQTFINGGGVGVPGLWVIGGTLLKYYYSAWYYTGKTVSLATTVQTPIGG